VPKVESEHKVLKEVYKEHKVPKVLKDHKGLKELKGLP
jgi:hypothetical protein